MYALRKHRKIEKLHSFLEQRRSVGITFRFSIVSMDMVVVSWITIQSAMNKYEFEVSTLFVIFFLLTYDDYLLTSKQ